VWDPVILPVFKTGGRQVCPVDDLFDSDTLPPEFLRCAQDFACGLPLADPGSLTPAKRLNFKTGGRQVCPVDDLFDSDTFPPEFSKS
jgi:hypothetical protein